MLRESNLKSFLRTVEKPRSFTCAPCCAPSVLRLCSVCAPWAPCCAPWAPCWARRPALPAGSPAGRRPDAVSPSRTRRGRLGRNVFRPLTVCRLRASSPGAVLLWRLLRLRPSRSCLWPSKQSGKVSATCSFRTHFPERCVAPPKYRRGSDERPSIGQNVNFKPVFFSFSYSVLFSCRPSGASFSAVLLIFYFRPLR